MSEDGGGFVHLLSVRDRDLLRLVVRRVHLGFLPASLVTDRECDRVIESIAPETLERIIRQARDAGRVGR